MSSIRCAIDSKKKKRKKKRKKTQSCSGACGVKSPKKCCDSLSDLQGSGRTHANVVDQSQMSIALLKALVDTRSSSTPSRSHACHLSTLRHAEKEKKLKIVFFNCSRLSPCSFHNWRWTSREASLHAQRETTLKHVPVGAGCGEEGYFIRHLNFERLRAFCERLCESWKTIIDVVFYSAS